MEWNPRTRLESFWSWPFCSHLGRSAPWSWAASPASGGAASVSLFVADSPGFELGPIALKADGALCKRCGLCKAPPYCTVVAGSRCSAAQEASVGTHSFWCRPPSDQGSRRPRSWSRNALWFSVFSRRLAYGIRRWIFYLVLLTFF